MTFEPEFLSRLIVEPLDRNRHDRAAFSCGIDRIDNFLKNTAARHADQDHGKVYVVHAPTTPSILGFYALSPHSIDISSFPEADQKRLPRLPTISAIYLSMIGVDRTAQGRGLGTYLMMDAMKRCVFGANIMGGHFIVLDALNENAARMYRRLGFTDLPSTPNRMLIAMHTVRKAMAD